MRNADAAGARVATFLLRRSPDFLGVRFVIIPESSFNDCQVKHGKRIDPGVFPH
jgi:hypothetical protein